MERPMMPKPKNATRMLMVSCMNYWIRYDPGNDGQARSSERLEENWFRMHRADGIPF